MRIEHENVRKDRKYRACLNNFAIACSFVIDIISFHVF